MSVPKLATIQNLLNYQKAKGITPKCSVFHLLPRRITMDIIKMELDRQKAERDTLDYWMERDAIARNPKALVPYYYRLVMRDVLKLGELNAVVQKGGHYEVGRKLDTWGIGLAYDEPKLIPQKKLQKSQINRKSKHNYIPAIIRHYSSLGSTMRNLELADSNAMGRRWLKVRLGWGITIDDENVLVSIKVIRLNRLRHLKDKRGGHRLDTTSQ